MSKKWTHSGCFAFYGTEAVSPRWSWSARSPDGRTVAVTFWQDKFENGGRRYTSTRHMPDPNWFDSLGHRELLGNLAWAQDHCGGESQMIIAIAKDTAATPRAIKECFPQPALRMRITHLDRATGAFVVERIEGGTAA